MANITQTSTILVRNFSKTYILIVDSDLYDQWHCSSLLINIMGSTVQRSDLFEKSLEMSEYRIKVKR